MAMNEQEAQQQPPSPQWSPDGRWWWNGQTWEPNPRWLAMQRTRRRNDRLIVIGAVLLGLLAVVGIIVYGATSGQLHG
jgi:hypothetical protein